MFQDTSFSQATATPTRDSINTLTHFFIKHLKLLEVNEGRIFVFHGRPVHLACVMGVLKNLEKTSTQMYYQIQDHSGSITCVKYLSNAIDDNENLKLESYIKMYGRMNLVDGKKVFVPMMIKPVAAFHEILFQRLSCIRDFALREQLSKGMSLAVAMGNPGRELAASLAGQHDHDFNATGSNMGGYNFDTALKNKIMMAIGSCTSPNGMTRQELEKSMPHVNQREFTDTLRFLADEGHVYTTLTDDHFQVTGS